MKVIFLDVDGVLNTHNLISKFGHDFIDDILVALIARIVRETEAKIVLSSTWRKYEKDKNLVSAALAPHELELFDSTPIIDRRIDNSWSMRSDEIQDWINKNPVEKFAIIDDDFDANIEGSFFQTDEDVGITVEIAERIIEHLR